MKVEDVTVESLCGSIEILQKHIDNTDKDYQRCRNKLQLAEYLIQYIEHHGPRGKLIHDDHANAIFKLVTDYRNGPSIV